MIDILKTFKDAGHKDVVMRSADSGVVFTSSGTPSDARAILMPLKM